MSKKSKSMHKKHEHGMKHIEEEVEEIEKDVHKLEKDVKLFAKFENIVFEIIIILIFGIALGALAGYMVGASQPVIVDSGNDSITVTDVTVPVGLAEKIESYVNTNLLKIECSLVFSINSAFRGPSPIIKKMAFSFSFNTRLAASMRQACPFRSTRSPTIPTTMVSSMQPIFFLTLIRIRFLSYCLIGSKSIALLIVIIFLGGILSFLI